MSITVITNNVPRDVIYGYELSPDERKEFDYLDFSVDGDGQVRDFVRYKGELIDLGDLESCANVDDLWKSWNGYRSDTFFSGILVRFVNNFEQVIMGRYYA